MTSEIGPAPGLTVVLVEPRNPLNIGAVARAMSNFGFFDLRLVDPYDAAFREAVSAVGAAELLRDAQVFRTVEEAVANCHFVAGATGLGNRQPHKPLLRLELAARQLRRRMASQSVALLFGSEKFGLSNDSIAYCQMLLRIPTREQHESMNLAQAVAVCLYELIRRPQQARPLAEPEAAPAATSEEMERVTALLREVLERSGYTDYELAIHAGDKTRRLVRRLALTSRDAAVWSGMLRQILWKLRQG